jgi:arginyl-tRNA synthetase
VPISHQAVYQLQGGEQKYRDAWQKICEVSRSEFDLVYKRLNVELEEKVLHYFCFTNYFEILLIEKISAAI